MGRKCQITGKARQSGNRVSHANNKTKRVFKANIQTKKLFIPELGKSLRLKISTNMLRTFDKLGVAPALKKYGLTVQDLI